MTAHACKTDPEQQHRVVQDDTVVHGGHCLVVCNNCASRQVRYSAVSLRFCRSFTAQCNTLQRGKKYIKKSHFYFSHIRDLCCTCSTACDYNNDMQGHKKECSSACFLEKAGRQIKSTWEVITVFFCQIAASCSLSWQSLHLKQQRNIHWN